MRDVQALCEMGIPVLSRDGVGGGYSLSPHYGIQPLELNWQEALLLVMALDGLSKLSDSPFSAERSSLVAKLRPLIPQRHLERLEELRESVTLEVPERQMRAPMLDAIVEVVGSGTWLNLEYDAAEGIKTITVRPDRVYGDSGLWYLVGLAENTSRTFRIDRISGVGSAEAPNVIEEPPGYHDPAHPLVRVKLTRRGARKVQREPHLGSSIDVTLDEQILEFRCPPSELDWYAIYFGGMGADALVMEPEELRSRIKGRASALLELYV